MIKTGLTLREFVEIVEDFKNKSNIDIKEISDEFAIGETFERFGYKTNHMLDANTYYPYLRSISILFRPNNVLELGTQIGSGTACFLSREDSRIVTADVNLLEISPKISMDKRVATVFIKDPIDILLLNFQDYDLIFVDIGHDGLIEYHLHNYLKSTKFDGIVLWDDINLDDRMRDFWKKVDVDKVSTSWHGDCGFGVTRYS